MGHVFLFSRCSQSLWAVWIPYLLLQWMFLSCSICFAIRISKCQDQGLRNAHSLSCNMLDKANERLIFFVVYASLCVCYVFSCLLSLYLTTALFLLLLLQFLFGTLCFFCFVFWCLYLWLTRHGMLCFLFFCCFAWYTATGQRVVFKTNETHKTVTAERKNSVDKKFLFLLLL